MNKRVVIKSLIRYFDKCGVHYHLSVDNEIVQILLTNEGEQCPNKYSECNLRFGEESMEALCYYSALGAKICRESAYRPELLRVIDFVNEWVLPSGTGSGGDPWYTPRLSLSEDECFDIMLETTIPYDMLKMIPNETMFYLRVHCPALLDVLSPAIFLVLAGERDVEYAVDFIREVFAPSE